MTACSMTFPSSNFCQVTMNCCICLELLTPHRHSRFPCVLHKKPMKNLLMLGNFCKICNSYWLWKNLYSCWHEFKKKKKRARRGKRNGRWDAQAMGSPLQKVILAGGRASFTWQCRVYSVPAIQVTMLLASYSTKSGLLGGTARKKSKVKDWLFKKSVFVFILFFMVQVVLDLWS